MSWHQLADSLEHGFGSGNIAEGQILPERAAVKLGRDSRIGKDGFDLRAEQKRASVPAIIEWLNAEAVSGREKHALAPIPYDKSEHAAQMFDAIPAVFLVEVDDSFRIAARAVSVSPGFQSSAQLGVVVDFAVVDDPNILALVGQRLMTCLDVNDAQPPHGQAHILLHEKTVIVGTTVRDALIHARQHVSLDAPVRV